MNIAALIKNVCHGLVDLRCEVRQQQTGSAEVSWIARGEFMTMGADFRDVSEGGAGLVSHVGLSRGSAVSIKVAGRPPRTAWVRYCRPAGREYHVGLEYAPLPGGAGADGNTRVGAQR